MSALDASRLDLIATVQRLSLATRSANLGTFDWDIPRDTRYSSSPAGIQAKLAQFSGVRP